MSEEKPEVSDNTNNEEQKTENENVSSSTPAPEKTTTDSENAADVKPSDENPAQIAEGGENPSSEAAPTANGEENASKKPEDEKEQPVSSPEEEKDRFGDLDDGNKSEAESEKEGDGGEEESPPKEEDETEKSIKGEETKPNRELFLFNFTRKNKHYALPLQERTTDAQNGYKFIAPFTDPKFDLEHQRKERSIGIQNKAVFIDKTIQTSWNRKINISVQCSMTDTKAEEENQTIITQDESKKILKFINSSYHRLTKTILENNYLSVYQDDFEKLKSTEDFFISGKGSESSLKDHQAFTHIESKNKKVACVLWQPKTKGTIVFSCVDPRSFEEKLYDKRTKEELSTSSLPSVVVWNFSDPLYPQMELKAPCEVNIIRFSPSDPNILVGGCENGQVIMWDLNDYQKEIDRCAKEEIYPFGDKKKKSKDQIPILNWKQLSHIDKKTLHKRPITGLEWLPDNKEMQKDGTLKVNDSGKSYQFLTIASDGQLFVWDIRMQKVKRGEIAKMKNEKLKDVWIPFTTFTIPRIDSAREVEANCLAIGSKIAERVVTVTLNGEIFVGDFSPKEPEAAEEEGNAAVAASSGSASNAAASSNAAQGNANAQKQSKDTLNEIMSNRKDSHLGPGLACDNHWFFSDVFLTVGQYSFKIWKDSCGIDGPLITSPFTKSTRYTCGKWSPTRYGVIVLGTDDGTIEVWDLIDKSNQPSTVMKLTQLAITSLDFKTIGSGKSKTTGEVSSDKLKGQFLAVGSSAGTVFIVGIPMKLVKPQTEEKEQMANFFDREEQRVQHYLRRWDHWRQKKAEAEENAKNNAAAAPNAAAAGDKNDKE